MDDVKRVEGLRAAADDLIDEDVLTACGGELERRLARLSEDGYARLCGAFSVAVARRSLKACVRHVAVYVVAGAAIMWSSTRISETWLILLSLAGMALILLSLCLDVLRYERLVHSKMRGLGVSADALLFGRDDADEVVSRFLSEVTGGKVA